MAVNFATRAQDPFFVTLRPYQTRATAAWRDPVDPAVATLLTAQASRSAGVLPWQCLNGTLYIAVSHPVTHHTLACLADLPQPQVLCRIEAEDLEFAQDRVYGVPANLADAKLGGILLGTQKIAAADLADALRVQPRSGGRIGSLLSSMNRVNHWDVAEGVAQQSGLPVIDLLHDPQERVDTHRENFQPIWDAFAEDFWFSNLTVPLYLNDTTIGVAMVDPQQDVVRKQLEAKFGRTCRIFVTGYRDAVQTLTMHFGDQHSTLSREALLLKQPEISAHQPYTQSQRIGIWGLILLCAIAFVIDWRLTAIVLNGIAQLLYLANACFHLWLMRLSTTTRPEVMVSGADLSSLNVSQLPPYTILVPLYKEAQVIPIITRAIQNLQYPKDRLDVKFLLEADDEETIAAAKRLQLPNYIDLVIVPASEPRTKPKACNYGFYQARGKYVVIFDAEDIPDPDQLLKAVAIFNTADDKLVCVQAKLSYFNSNQNILTRWFTAEYAMWFDLRLPALFATNLPIPLGGTSNHFRADVLRQMGAWDPFNVTEDADLGIRLYRHGYRTTVMDSVTKEEANSEYVNWVRQRSRWVKGYMQTWLVHMRRPDKLWRDLGPRGFFGFHLVIGGTPFVMLANPIFWGMTTLWFVAHQSLVHEIFPTWIYYTAFLNLVFGNFAFTYANVVGMGRREDWSLVKYAALTPIYWTFMSVAAWKGLYQLVTRPFYWEKTHHGLTNQGDVTTLTHESEEGSQRR